MPAIFVALGFPSTRGYAISTLAYLILHLKAKGITACYTDKLGLLLGACLSGEADRSPDLFWEEGGGSSPPPLNGLLPGSEPSQDHAYEHRKSTTEKHLAGHDLHEHDLQVDVRRMSSQRIFSNVVVPYTWLFCFLVPALEPRKAVPLSIVAAHSLSTRRPLDERLCSQFSLAPEQVSRHLRSQRQGRHEVPAMGAPWNWRVQTPWLGWSGLPFQEKRLAGRGLWFGLFPLPPEESSC